MILELSGIGIVKIAAPAIAAITKECASFVKISNQKWDAGKITERLTKKIEDINTVKTLWARDKGVPLESFYYPSKVIDKFSSHEIDTLSTLAGQNMVVEGIVGQGKSIYLRNMCTWLLEKKMIPVFIELRTLSPERTLLGAINEYLESCGISGGDPIFRYLAGNGRVALLLDGFDEIPTGLVKSVVNEIEMLRNISDSLQIMISSRPYQEAQKLHGFYVYELAPLDSTDHELFLKKIIDSALDRARLIEALLETPENISGVMTTPLMLTLLVMVYKNDGEIPSTLPDFYEKLFTTVTSAHDSLKPAYKRDLATGFSEVKLRNLFDAFCVRAIQQGGDRTLSYQKFKKCFETAVRSVPESSCELHEFRSDIINATNLMLAEGINETTFLHKSIMEFHAASFIKNSSDEVAEIFYERALLQFGMWQEVISFLANIDAYRYASWFILRDYPILHEKLKAILIARTKPAIIEFITYVFPTSSVIFKAGVPKSLRHVGDSRENVAVLEIRSYLVSIIFHQMSRDDIEKVIAAAPKPLRIEDGDVVVELSYVLEQMDLAGLWARLTALENEIWKEILRCRKVVEDNNKRSLIFD